MNMNGMALSKAPASLKLFATAMLLVVGLIYLTLLVHIWIDTEMKASNIAEAYGGMEYIELTDHAHTYLPYYSFFVFLFPVLIFMFTSFGEGLKRFFAVFPFIVIVIDIGSMYLIPYLWRGFGWVLFFAGTMLGFMFMLLFILNVYDLWLRKPSRNA
jgi:hypothetical protein